MRQDLLGQPTSARMALEQCIELWSQIVAREILTWEQKNALHIELFGYDQYEACPACEWDKIQCPKLRLPICACCPIDIWRKKHLTPSAHTPCVGDLSSFGVWRKGRKSDQERLDGAKRIIELARESLAALNEDNDESR